MTSEDRKFLAAVADYIDAVLAGDGDAAVKHQKDTRLALGQILGGSERVSMLPETIKLTVDDYGA
jgi:hypothetical protein